MPFPSNLFAKKLIAWYLENKRDLPWRSTSAPYPIWLSEIILQQTRVDQGLPYYLKFIAAFPTVTPLAEAPEAQVLKLWQGLGYYSRARNLHKTAKQIAFERNGQFPNSYEGLLKLKGVGEYTAAAIASICYNEATAAVDGNVYRVLARIFGLETPTDSPAGKREFKALAQRLLDPSQPANFNQALMEFGARHCVPKNPACGSCIFKDSCAAFQKEMVFNLPVKLKKKPVKNRYFNYLVVLSNNNETILKQRLEKGIWQHLFEFPLIETETEVALETLKETEAFKRFSEKIKFRSISLYNEKPVCHKLSHQHLHTRFWIVEVVGVKEMAVGFSEINSYAVPVLIENFVSEFGPFKIEKPKLSNSQILTLP